MNRRGRQDVDGAPESRSGIKPSLLRYADQEKKSAAERNMAKGLDRERDLQFKSKPSQNSNWRQSSHLDKTPPINNSGMPQVSVKKDIIYTPSFKAVDNLIPKFLSVDLKDQNESASKHQTQRCPVLTGVTNTRQTKSNSVSWRTSEPQRTESNARFELPAGGGMSKKLMDMLGSKGKFYTTMNNLDSTTWKVQVEDFEREELAREHVKKECELLYPHCKITQYGQRLLGLAFPQNAIYLSADPGNCYHLASNESKELLIKIRKSLFKVLLTCGHCTNVRDWDIQEMVTFRHVESDLNCIVSFGNGFREQNSLLLKLYLQMDRRFRLLTLLVTDMVHWAHDISKYFTSHGLNIMIIMFLQQLPDPVLPTLQKIRESGPYEPNFIGGFDCGFPKDVTFPPSSNRSSVESLLKEFCAFYKNFDFEKEVITIQGPITRPKFFENLSSLKHSDNLPKIDYNHPIIVQEPFELNRNAAEKVTPAVLEIFQRMCHEACDILKEWC